VLTAGTPLSSGIVVGAAVAPMILLAFAHAVVGALKRNHPQLVQGVRDLQAEPEWQTLLSGRVRWMIAALAVSIVSSVATVVIFANVPLALVPVAGLAVVSDLAAYTVGRRGSARGWLAIQVAAAIILVVGAVVVSG
jgi:hypothetical protein